MKSYSEEMLQALNDNDLVEAQLKFEAALRHDPSEILTQLGEQLLNAGFLEEAELIFKQLLAKTPEQVELGIPLAEIAIENDQIEEAFTYLETIPVTHASYAESLLVLADLYHLIGLPEVSQKKLLEAQRLVPGERIIELALAELYFATDQLTEAIPLYESLLPYEDELGHDIDLSNRLGTALSQLGEFEEAIPYLEACVEEEQTDHGLYQLAITYIQLGERQKAIAYLQQLRLLNPTFEGLYLPLASAMLDENMNNEAELVMNEGLAQNPYAVDLYHLASDNAYRLGKASEAEEFMRKAVTLEEDNEFSLIKLSNLLLVEERYEDVVDTLSELGSISHPHAYWSLAQAYNGLEEFKLAAEAYGKAYAELGHEPGFLKDYGLFLREEGQLTLAQTVLKHYLELVPEDIDVHTLLDS